MKTRAILLGGLLVWAVGCSGSNGGPVDSAGLTGADETVAAPESAPNGCVTASARLETAAPLNLREAPAQDAPVLLTLHEGAELSATTDGTCPQNGYYKVRFGGFEGWAYGAWLRSTQLQSGLGYANTRDEAIARAKAGVGFSYWWGHGRWLPTGPTSTTKGACTGSCPSCSHSGSYGADCSGFVAKVWVVPSSNDDVSVDSHPYSTWHFESEPHGWHSISRSNIQRADAMVYNDGGAGHIFIYEKGDPWGSMYAYECKGCSDGCVYNVRTASTAYKAISRDNIASSVRKRADIAAFYSGASVTQHIWKSATTSFTYAGSGGWWSADTGYALGAVADRFVSGDFNGDGRDDTATFYDYGSGAARIHVFLSTGTSFSYNSGGWWSTTSGYALSNVGNRMVAGDFNGDGKDDIAAFYDYGSGAARLHVFLSTGSSFTYDSGGWWGTTSGYSLSNVAGRLVSGDFNKDGRADVAAFYDYGSGAARLHVFLSTGGGFSYDSGGWWSTTSGYSLGNVADRLTAGDFNGDGRDDVAAFYDYGSGAARLHVFASTGGGFSYDSGGWWNTTSGYALSNVGNRLVAGDFNKDGRADVATLYDYGSGAARIHVFASTGGGFSYDSGGWWSTASGYSASSVAGRFVSGDFDGL